MFRFLVNAPFNLHYYEEDGEIVEINDLHTAVDYLYKLQDKFKCEVTIMGGENNRYISDN